LAYSYKTNNKKIDWALGRPAWAIRTMSMLLTSKHPGFIPVNWLRDVQFGLASHIIKDTGDPVMFMKSLPLAAKTIHRHMMGKLDPENKQYPTDAMFVRFLKNGGRTGWVHTKDVDKDVEYHKRQLDAR